MKTNNIAWSWSRLNDFEKCPRQAYWKHYVDKALRCPFEENEHLRRGKNAHFALENAVNKQAPLAAPWKVAQPAIDGIHKAQAAGAKVFTELQVALTKELNTTGWFTGEVWLRSIFDVLVRSKNKSLIVDWKTGKVYEMYDQLKLFALTEFAINPAAEEVKTAYYYLDSNGKQLRKSYTRDHYPELLEEFSERAELIQVASETPGPWEAKPSDFNCKWCPCTKYQCEFSRKGDAHE